MVAIGGPHPSLQGRDSRAHMLTTIRLRGRARLSVHGESPRACHAMWQQGLRSCQLPVTHWAVEIGNPEWWSARNRAAQLAHTQLYEQHSLVPILAQRADLQADKLGHRRPNGRNAETRWFDGSHIIDL